MRVAYAKDFDEDTTGFEAFNEEANSKYESGEGQAKGKISFRIKYAEDDFDDFNYKTSKNVKIPFMTNEKGDFENPTKTKLTF